MSNEEDFPNGNVEKISFEEKGKEGAAFRGEKVKENKERRKGRKRKKIEDEDVTKEQERAEDRGEEGEENKEEERKGKKRKRTDDATQDVDRKAVELCPSHEIVVKLTEVIEKGMNHLQLQSKNPFHPKVLDVNKSLNKLIEYVTGPTEKLVMFPQKRIASITARKETSTIVKVLENHFANTKGFLYFATDMTSSFNLNRCKKRPADVLLHVFVLTTCGPPAVLTVIQNRENSSRKIEEYSISLSREITLAVRDYTNEDFHFRSEVIDIDRDVTPKHTCTKIENITRNIGDEFCQNTQTMSKFKFKNILAGFLVAIGSTDIPHILKAESNNFNTDVGDDDDKQVYLMTNDQFSVIFLHLDMADILCVTGETQTGKTVLTLELARRLNITGNILFITESKKLKKQASFLEICSRGMSKRAFINDKNSLKNVKHVVSHDDDDGSIFFKNVDNVQNAHSVIAQRILKRSAPEGVKGYFEDELRIILIGKRGTGKSVLANNILGERKFASEPSFESVTKKCSHVEFKRNNKKILIVDTPELFDTFTLKRAKEEVSRCILLSAPGPHIIVLVTIIDRFTEKDVQTFEAYTRLFGDDFKDHLVVLFTRCDDLEAEKVTFEEYIETIPFNLKKLLNACDRQYVGFNNRANEDQLSRNISNLFALIDAIVEKNGNKYYTSEFYRKAEKMMQAKDKVLLEETAKDRKHKVMELTEKSNKHQKQGSQQFKSTLQSFKKNQRKRLKRGKLKVDETTEGNFSCTAAAIRTKVRGEIQNEDNLAIEQVFNVMNDNEWDAK